MHILHVLYRNQNPELAVAIMKSKTDFPACAYSNSHFRWVERALYRPVVAYFNDFLDDVVDDEDDVDDLAGEDKVVVGIDVSEQLRSVKAHVGEDSS